MSVRHQTLTRFGKNVGHRRKAAVAASARQKANLNRTYVSGIERDMFELGRARVAAALRTFEIFLPGVPKGISFRATQHLREIGASLQCKHQSYQQ